MERLGFEAAQLMTPIRDLSGGQKRRMQLLLILLDEPNVLIMDEPGNDLDTDMLAVMEDLLDTWPGTLIVVSHDRYLLERVTDQQFALIGGKVRHLPGGVDDYLRMVDDIKAGRDPFGGASAGGASKAGKAGRSTAGSNGAGVSGVSVAGTPMSGAGFGAAGSDAGGNRGGRFDNRIRFHRFRNRRHRRRNGGRCGSRRVRAIRAAEAHRQGVPRGSKRVAQIERRLAKLEAEKGELEERMAAHDPSDYAGLNEMNTRLQAIAEETEPLEFEWMELSEQLE